HAVEIYTDSPIQLHEQAVSWYERFERLNELGDLHRSIIIQQRAVELMDEDHAQKPVLLYNLGLFLQVRFQHLGDLADIQHSVSILERSVALTPEGHPNRPMRLDNLAISASYRYHRLGELDDLENAIATGKLALELTPKGHPDWPLRLGNLANSVQKLALELTPKGHPDRPMRLGNLAASMFLRFQKFSNLEDLERSLAMHQCAANLAPIGHSQKPLSLVNLGITLRTRFEYLGDFDDVENSVATHKLAMDLTPEGDADRPRQLHNSGLAMKTRFMHCQSKMHFDAAFDTFMQATMESLGSPSTRLSSAQECVSLLSEYPEFGSAELLLDAHSRIIQIFPEIVWLGHSINRRYEESAKLGEVVNAAISAFIDSRSRYQAIEWMEVGRSLVWSQLLSLREPIDDLKAKHPELAAQLKAISLALQQSGNISYSAQRERESSGESTLLSVPHRHRQLAIKYQNILKNVREQEGFQNFLKPPSITARMPSIERLDGPVVFINVHSSSCDALALFPNGAVRHIALPDLTQDGARNLHSTWTKLLGSSNVRTRGAVSLDRLVSEFRCTNMFGIVLWKLWTWVVRPILQALHFMESTLSEPLPHITWCPTGPLTQLPLHAAGIYDFTQPARSQRVFDFVVSSYTPSLSALLRSREGLSARPSPSQPNVLVVAQPETPGYATLPYTRLEGERVGSVLTNSAPTLLIDKAATVEGTIAAMRETTWVHLACHGYQKKEDPTQSAFALDNGPLTLGALMGEVAENAELAFLSACETAVGDEKIPEESAHLAAGMLAVGFKGVVGTMWSIGDADAPIVVEAYYKKLLELRGSGAVREGYTGAAYALHDAVRALREQVGEKNFVRWAPFVHFGV
ncbi:hypothetical protein PENSPDRAFT_725982, partial [Peniophora sp. CONT]